MLEREQDVLLKMEGRFLKAGLDRTDVIRAIFDARIVMITAETNLRRAPPRRRKKKK